MKLSALTPLSVCLYEFCVASHKLDFITLLPTDVVFNERCKTQTIS